MVKVEAVVAAQEPALLGLAAAEPALQALEVDKEARALRPVPVALPWEAARPRDPSAVVHRQDPSAVEPQGPRLQ